MKEILHKIVTKKNSNPFIWLLRGLLWVLSLVYVSLLKLKYFGYRFGVIKPRRLDTPVISVGNITVGGVGKTPLVLFLAKYISQQGRKPVILIRGYMDRSSAHPSEGSLPLSDEALMLKKKLPGIPVLIGPDRFENATAFLNNNDADVFILDDGFQHWKIARDLDIVVIDSNNPFGQGYILPRGILREPVSHLKRADFFVLTKSDRDRSIVTELTQKLADDFPKKNIALTVHQLKDVIDLKTGELIDKENFRQKKCCVFCSIGDPASFEFTLVNLGLNLKQKFFFLDHHVYSDGDLQPIIDFCHENDIKNLFTTEKDAVKLENKLHLFNDVKIFIIKIELEFLQGKDQLLERIDRLL